jgi:DNA-binding MarR family transcriptional regulator
MASGSKRFRGEQTAEGSLGDALELLRRIWQLSHEIERASARMARTLGITGQQRMTLRVIGRFPGITAGDLSDRLCVDAATVSTALARLEKKKLVTRQRDATDGRRVRVLLTAAGRKLDVPDTGTIESAVSHVVANSPAGDIETVHRIFEALTTRLREVGEEQDKLPAARPRRAR